MGASEHVGFTHDARSDEDRVDGGIKLGVSRGHEDLFQPGPESSMIRVPPPSSKSCHQVVIIRAAVAELAERMTVFSGFSRGQDRLIFVPVGVHDQGQVVNELVLAPNFLPRTESTKLVDHSACDASANPYIAIEDPDKISLGFPISAAHVSDFRIGAKTIGSSGDLVEMGIFILDQNSTVIARKAG